MKISTGDYHLNYQNQYGPPCLVPSPSLEKALDFRKLLFKSEDTTTRKEKTCAIHIHCYYEDELLKIFDALENKLTNFDLFITTNSRDKQEAITTQLKSHPLGNSARKWEAVQTPDRGRNIGPLLIDIFGRLTEYECVLHMHTKKSKHSKATEEWRNGLHHNLIGSKELISDIRYAFETRQELGVLIPQPCEAMRNWCNWGLNFSLAKMILKEVFEDVGLHIEAPLVFPMGMMFWFRPSAIAKLSEACWKLQPLPLEPLPLDGSTLHAMERLVAHCCEASGYRWQMICSEDPEDETPYSGHQPSVLTPLTETYIQISSILAIEMRKLELDTKETKKLNEDKTQEAKQNLRQREDELLRTQKELQLCEQELLKAKYALKVLNEESKAQRNRLSARIASWIMR